MKTFGDGPLGVELDPADLRERLSVEDDHLEQHGRVDFKGHDQLRSKINRDMAWKLLELLAMVWISMLVRGVRELLSPHWTCEGHHSSLNLSSEIRHV